jgi:hypothetical protein
MSFSRGSFVIGNGMNTKFWEDTWVGNKSLDGQYQSLYNIFHHKISQWKTFLGFVNINIGFR